MDGPTVRKTFKIVKTMRNEILKYFSFLFTLLLLSCGGGGGDDTGGGGGGGGGQWIHHQHPQAKLL